MALFNFSAREGALIERALGFVNRQEVDPALAGAVLIVKTAAFADECDRLAPYYPLLGLENRNSRLVFDASRHGGHKILINQETISGLSFVHTLVGDLVHLANLGLFAAEHGNFYRFDQEQAIARHWHEFLLWSRFQAMRVATRAHALCSWHEANGDAPPADGCYRFEGFDCHSPGLEQSLRGLAEAGEIGAWREGLWDLLEEAALSFGRMAFLQQEARPEQVDGRFPAEAIEQAVGLDNALALYGAMLQSRHYGEWSERRRAIRAVILEMQERGRARFAPGV